MLGAKTTGIIVSILNAIQKGNPITHTVFFQTGIVFYGGVLGLIFSFYMICLLKNKHPPVGALDALAVIIPLFHAVARIGCFCAGCCYGVEARCWISVYYIIEENGVSYGSFRIPVQLIESCFNLLLFILLLVLFLKQIQIGKLIYLYLFLYAVIRFSLEFFRGDAVRGIYGGISFSQIISMVIILFVSFKYLKGRKKNGLESH